MTYPKFIISRDPSGMYFFRLFTARQKQLLTGFNFEQRSTCIDGVRELHELAKDDDHYNVHTENACFYFEITDHSHKVIARSPVYRTMAGMAFGIHAVKSNIVKAMMEDHRPVLI
jgi:uncharacterized protein YegP (UPF0339 family)